jgi:hypothetical protein
MRAIRTQAFLFFVPLCALFSCGGFSAGKAEFIKEARSEKGPWRETKTIGALTFDAQRVTGALAEVLGRDTSVFWVDLKISSFPGDFLSTGVYEENLYYLSYRLKEDISLSCGGSAGQAPCAYFAYERAHGTSGEASFALGFECADKEAVLVISGDFFGTGPVKMKFEDPGEFKVVYSGSEIKHIEEI